MEGHGSYLSPHRNFSSHCAINKRQYGVVKPWQMHNAFRGRSILSRWYQRHHYEGWKYSMRENISGDGKSGIFYHPYQDRVKRLIEPLWIWYYFQEPQGQQSRVHPKPLFYLLLSSIIRIEDKVLMKVNSLTFWSIL